MSANTLETFERFDPLIDAYQAARSAHFDRYAAGEQCTEEVDELDARARARFLEALADSGVTLGIYRHDRASRELLTRAREAREHARPDLVHPERASVRHGVDALSADLVQRAVWAQND